MAVITVEQGLLRRRCRNYEPHGDCSTFGGNESVMCLSPHNGVQILALEEARNCIAGVFQVRCPLGCVVRGRVTQLRVDQFGNEVELGDVVVGR